MESPERLMDEQKEAPKELVVWVVDDWEVETTAQYIQMQFNGRVKVVPFKTGESALEEIKKEGATLPDLIIVDGELDADEEELRMGDEVVKRLVGSGRLKPLCGIIPFSTKREINQKIYEAGGARVVSGFLEAKNTTPVISYIERLLSTKSKRHE
ncbi:MAG: hypothetical protein KBC26_01660 [Candidatus Pacebacteria bacterium]|nr:hypothetical protein [Candidatus Paceibacterota bacterium]